MNNENNENNEKRKEKSSEELIINRVDDEVIEDGLGCCLVFCMTCFQCFGGD